MRIFAQFQANIEDGTIGLGKLKDRLSKNQEVDPAEADAIKIDVI